VQSSRKIKVIVVDDSILFREILTRGLSSDPDIEVVAAANDPFDAIKKIIRHKPDVMTCDVEMPRMNGIEFIRRLLPKHPLPVIVVSSVSSSVFDAMDAGAVDFVGKPDMSLENSVESFINDMIAKIKIASKARILQDKEVEKPHIEIERASDTVSEKIIAIGASTGGPEAIRTTLKSLPEDIPGIVIVQHMPPLFSRMFAERLDAITSLRVKEAQTGDQVKQGQVLIAPGDKHMIVKRMGDGYIVECYDGEKVNRHRPSVDILFESVANAAGKNAIGVILTGMGSDGAKGLLAMREKGARTIGQDEETSVVYGMPKAAFEIGAVEIQAPLKSIPGLLMGIR
jgi:two-component system chemotaxis response regulator CheB